MHGANLALHALGALAVTFVDHENVGNFHDPGFDRLHIVAHAGHQNHDGDIGQPHDVDFVLPHAHRFNHDQVAPRSIEHSGRIGSGARQPSQRSACCHAANVNPRIAIVVLHANAVAQNRSARVRAGRVDRDDADGLIFLAIVLGQLIDQRALARSGSASQTDDPRLARMRKERLEQIRPAGSAVLDGRDGASQRAGVAGAEASDLWLLFLDSNCQCKAVPHTGKKFWIRVFFWAVHICAGVTPWPCQH